jgi:hypothetical protein
MPKKNSDRSRKETAGSRASSPVEEMLLAALERGDDSLETGRYIATFKENAVEEGLEALGAQGLRVADARDFQGQAAVLEGVGDAEVVVFPEIGAVLLGGDAVQERAMAAATEIASDSPLEAIEPEYFVFPEDVPRHDNPREYLRGFAHAVETITKDLGDVEIEVEADEDPLVVGATWGLIRCNVPQSARSGAGIKLAVLDTGMDIGHPDFSGRPIANSTFVGQPVQDLHSHGTHCIGTACGPKAPTGSTPRYGTAFRASIFVGKVLSNSGSSVSGSVLAGINWAIANRCTVISMSLGSQSPVSAYYTAAGASAMSKGCLIIAAAGNAASNTGAPANSPTVLSVASLDPTLAPSAFSNFGKIEIAAPGRDIFSSVPRPIRYGIKNGTSMATPHVAGCAALWAESSASLRGMTLWKRLQATAKKLPYPAARVGAGLVQAP